MPISLAGKKVMLDALAAAVTHAGLLTKGTAITAVTGTAATDVFAKAAHGLSNGALVTLTEMTGGAGLIAGDAGDANGAAEPLFVIAATANDFQLSRTSGGTAVNFTTDITAVTVTPLTEISGGSPAYARKAIAWNGAADAGANGVEADDSTNGAIFDVPASTIDYAGFFTALTAGTNHGVRRVTSEVFAAQGTYNLQDADLRLAHG